ncbi:hypothetical protein GIB67_016599 [Kingdonia uniflora]|uniref:Uncharacterized protein n=1 Tax=Kingdonia uniflora TaxID=39325 RepID=A0A7J7MZ49_9MAGN|nr:hypothetical protein GIB67_016599 [Kingdonia uniflora]
MTELPLSLTKLFRASMIKMHFTIGICKIRNSHLEESKMKKYHLVDKWYREHIVWADKALNMKLIRKGILTRIYAPMAIVQGLRQSGVFSSVILSAQTTLSKDKFLSSVESSNSSKAISTEVQFARKIGKSRESQATVRKVLENVGMSSHPQAIPPLSPPAMNQFHMVAL